MKKEDSVVSIKEKRKERTVCCVCDLKKHGSVDVGLDSSPAGWEEAVGGEDKVQSVEREGKPQIAVSPASQSIVCIDAILCGLYLSKSQIMEHFILPFFFPW